MYVCMYVCVNIVNYCRVLSLECQYKGSYAPSVRIPVVDEERMRQGRWMESVICVSFSASTLLVG